MEAALFEKGAPIWLVIPQAGPLIATWTEAHGAREGLTWRDPDEDASEACKWAFCVAKVRWQPGILDELFEGIADDQGRTVLADLDALRVLASYDGGFDVVWSPAEVGRLRRRFASWPSPRADGL